MATHLVNLDALITREDLEVTAKAVENTRVTTEFGIRDLAQPEMLFIRKPDFQRETAAWSSDQIVSFVRSFVDGDLIPSIIMWRSASGSNFVIDGAHRLSALMAWVLDDYGDGTRSKAFFGSDIPMQQMKFAKKTRDQMRDQIGSYVDLSGAVNDVANIKDETVLRRAKNLFVTKLDLQWVRGTAATAESSFFRINGSPSVIDATELDVIRARRKPNAIATRALINAGTGHKYWSTFGNEAKAQIEDLSKDINEALFKPLLSTPIKTLDLPVAGQPYSAVSFRMILDLVNLVNNVTPAMWQEMKATKRRKEEPARILLDDPDGHTTVKFLQRSRAAAHLITGDYPGSLGLHPVVYFYGSNGRFQPAAFLSTVQFVLSLKATDSFIQFTEVRHDFEEFLISHRHFVNALSRDYGSRTRSLDALELMYRTIYEELRDRGSSQAEIVAVLLALPKLKPLVAVADENSPQFRRNFSNDEKSVAFLRKAIDSPVRCGICRARLHSGSIMTDHVIRKEDGGRGDSENAQPTHPFCNTGYKEHMTHRARLQPLGA
jgi:hypothetical protein